MMVVMIIKMVLMMFTMLKVMTMNSYTVRLNVFYFFLS